MSTPLARAISTTIADIDHVEAGCWRDGSQQAEVSTPTIEGSQKESKKSTPTDENDVEILDWEGPNDPANPPNFSNTRKWLIVGAGLLGTLLLPLNGTSITVAAHAINAEFGISDANFPNSYWTVTSWSIGGVLFILVGA